MYVLNVGPASVVVLTANVEKLLRSEEFVGDITRSHGSARVL